MNSVSDYEFIRITYFINRYITWYVFIEEDMIKNN